MSSGETSEAMERAREAAILLDERGQKVTARAVQALAGVRMAIAARAAKEFNDAEDELDQAVAAVPAVVVSASEMVWNKALAEAAAQVEPEVIGLREQGHTYRTALNELVERNRALELEVRRLEAVQVELVAEWQQLNVAAHECLSDKHAAQRELAELKGEEFDAERLWIATTEELAAKQHERPAVLEYSQDEDYLEEFDKDMSES